MRGKQFDSRVSELLSKGQSVDEVARELHVAQRVVRRVANSSVPRAELTDALAKEVRKRLANGQFESRISNRLNVSRSAVTAIAKSMALTSDRDTQLHHHHEDPARCPTCGSMVYLPCLKCTIEASRKRNPEVCNIEMPDERDMATVFAAIKATVNDTRVKLTTVAEQLLPLENEVVHPERIPGNARKLESFNLRRLMAIRNMSTERLVAITGVDERTIRGIRKGTAKPHERTINKLAKGLGVDVDEFYRMAEASQELAGRKPR